MKPRRRSIDIVTLGFASIAPFERKRGVMAAGRERRGGRVGRMGGMIGWVQTMQELLPPWRYVVGVLGTGPQRAGGIADNKLGLIARWRKGGKGEKRKEGRRKTKRIGMEEG